VHARLYGHARDVEVEVVGQRVHACVHASMRCAPPPRCGRPRAPGAAAGRCDNDRGRAAAVDSQVGEDDLLDVRACSRSYAQAEPCSPAPITSIRIFVSPPQGAGRICPSRRAARRQHAADWRTTIPAVNCAAAWKGRPGDLYGGPVPPPRCPAAAVGPGGRAAAAARAAPAARPGGPVGGVAGGARQDAD
jgi:hypothetical protein